MRIPNKFYILILIAIATLFTSTPLSYANSINIHDALKQYKEQNLLMPIAESDGRVQTLNKMGAMSPVLDKASLNFIEFSKNKKVLEIGGGYGFMMGKVLEKYPDVIYHMNDLDKRHIFIAAHNISTFNITPKTLDNIKFIAGDISEIEIEDKYDAILVARVLHFMNPEKLNKTVSKLYNLLKPNGRVYVIAITPYVKRYQKFIKEYEDRLNKGDLLYPGYVTSLRDWLNIESISSSQNAAISNEPFMFLDVKVMNRLFSDNNFKVILCETAGLGYQSESWSLDGRENVILIAEKN